MVRDYHEKPLQPSAGYFFNANGAEKERAVRFFFLLFFSGTPIRKFKTSADSLRN